MKRSILLAVLLLLASSPALAKLKVFVAVRVKNDENIKAEIERGLQARINSTERYTALAVTNPTPAETDFVLNVGCIVLEREHGQKTGLVCYSTVTFFPFENSGLNTDLEAGSMVVSPLQNTDYMAYIAEGLIDTFINGTTDEALENCRSILRYSVRAYCSNHSADCATPRI